MYPDVRDGALSGERVEEGHRLAPRFDERQRQAQFHYAKGDARNTRARSDVQDAERRPRQEGPEEQRVEKKPAPDLRPRLERGEVMRPVPEDQKIGVAPECFALCRAEEHTSELQ